MSAFVTNAETGIFQGKPINTMAADALAPCVIGSLGAMVLTVQDQQVLVFHKEKFQLPLPTLFQEVLENANVFQNL